MSPQLMLLLGGGLVLAGMMLVLKVLTNVRAERGAVAESLAMVRNLGADLVLDVGAESERSFIERVVGPASVRMLGLGRRLVRADAAERLQHRLDIAGNPEGWDVTRILGCKALCLVAFGGLGLLYALAAGMGPLQLLVVPALLAALGFVVPNILLYNFGQKRELLMQRALPDAMDLLTVSVEAGLGFDAAVMKVARNTRGPLAKEFSRLLQELQIGTGRADAMRALAERSTLRDLRGFSMAVVQADQLGVPIGRVLRVQSHEMRLKRRQRAEEQAQKVPVKIMVPLVLFVLPSLLIVVAGPAAVNMLGVFG